MDQLNDGVAIVMLVNIADPVRMSSLGLDTEPSLPVPKVFGNLVLGRYNDLTVLPNPGNHGLF